ncbi:unannotated protein [freshwater metagenome]|uniref:glycerol kinase n=1 Tax=freshwater metagenome TaxID=449393 RepID=A0A6J7XVY6_9ZZZZ|nr:glycerol kinase GlpK [Actinomycetota bacterium]
MSYIGALDQGTSSTRFIIFDHAGNVISQSQKEHEQILPHSGWVEHDANEIWRNAQEVISSAMSSATLTGADLVAIGITNQRETTVAWDVTTGKPLHNAIVWQDTRTSEFMDDLQIDTQEHLKRLTGLTISPYFSASKMNWLMRNMPLVANAIANGSARFGTMDSWLVWNLTGGVSGGTHVTDVTNASRTMLMNLETLDWDQSLLDIFNIPRETLAAIKSSSEIHGYCHPSGPLGEAVPIAAVLGDQNAAMIGQVRFENGESKTTYGTGNFTLLNTGTDIIRSKNGLLTTVCFKLGDAPAQYALEGSVAVTGSAIQWLRDQLGIIANADETEKIAATVPDTGGVYFVPAFSGLMAPYWKNDARGIIVGLTRATTKAHIVRATLEAICYQTRDVLDAMATDAGHSLTEMRVDGGGTRNALMMQMQSDALGIEIVRPVISETTSLGAAYAAGLAVKYWSSTDEIRSLWQESMSWNPQNTQQMRTTGYATWKKAIERTLNWVE